MPLRVLADLAAWYFALHSCEVSACAGAVAKTAANPDAATAHNNLALIVILLSLADTVLEFTILT
jgi:hypothetical protein